MSDSVETAKRIERFKILWDISEASPIIRRYFAMNFFDGVLTALGIVLPGLLFTIFPSLFNSEDITFLSRGTLFLTGLTTAVAIGISGLTGSHLAESAERKLNVIQMKKVLGLLDEDDNHDAKNSSEPKYSEKDIRLALGRFESAYAGPKAKSHLPSSLHLGLTPEQAKKMGVHLHELEQNKSPASEGETKKVDKYVKYQGVQKDGEKENGTTIFEEAQLFAGRIAALVDGLSPFLGVLVVILPFLFGPLGEPPKATAYIISYLCSIFVLFMLGRYLAKLSKASVLKYGMQMIFAAVLTSVITVFFNFLLT